MCCDIVEQQSEMIQCISDDLTHYGGDESIVYANTALCAAEKHGMNPRLKCCMVLCCICILIIICVIIAIISVLIAKK